MCSYVGNFSSAVELATSLAANVESIVHFVGFVVTHFTTFVRQKMVSDNPD